MLRLGGRRSLVGVWAAALAMTLATPGPAAADVGVFRDASGDIAAGADLLRVHVTNARQVRVRTVHRDLRPRQLAQIAIYFDVNPRRVGPEYLFYSGLGAERDWHVSKVRRWVPGPVLDCPSGSQVNHRLDVGRFSLGRSCLAGHRGRVRVAVQVRVVRRDWLGQRRQLTPWIRR